MFTIKMQLINKLKFADFQSLLNYTVCIQKVSRKKHLSYNVFTVDGAHFLLNRFVNKQERKFLGSCEREL